MVVARRGVDDGGVRLPDLGARGQGWVWVQALVMGAIPTVGGLAPPWPPTWRVPMVMLGAVLLLAGCALLVIGLLALGESFAVFPEPADDATLVSGGIYSRARHPIFGGWILVGLGFATGLSPWALPLAGLLALELWGKAAVEERHLAARYREYGEYRRAVPRWFFPAVTRPAGVTARTGDR